MAAGGERAAAHDAPLPPVTVARFQEATRLIEVLVDENTDLFIDRMASYRERARAGSARRLTPAEAAQVAAAIGGAMDQDAGQVAQLAGKIQKGSLRTVDEPNPQEVLLAGGLATAPAFIAAALQVVALLELPAETFEAAREAGTLRDEVAAAAKVLADLPLADARARAARAMQNLAEGAGTSEGEAWSLLTSTVRQAFDNALLTMADRMQTAPLESLTGSPETTDGPGDESSTTPGTPTP